MKARFLIQAGILAMLGMIGAGCAPFKGKPKLEPESPPVITPTVVKTQNVSDGSLWAGNDDWSLFADVKAFKPGDLVLVRIIENSQAEKNTKTEVKRDSTLHAGISNFFGKEAAYGTGAEAHGSNKNIDLGNLIKTENTSQFASDAKVSQSGKVLANVMAQVIEHRPDGNLRIFGSQVVTIGPEDQVVTVNGLIRPSDIAADNSVSSQLIADARIVYSGRGPGERSSRPGWLLKAYYAVWPF